MSFFGGTNMEVENCKGPFSTSMSVPGSISAFGRMASPISALNGLSNGL